MESIKINIAVEDVLSEAVVKTIFKQIVPNLEAARTFGLKGNLYLKSNIRAFNNAAGGRPFFIVTDLDNKYKCPMELRSDWIKIPLHRNVIFRIAIKEIEAWILADLDGFATFLSVPKIKLPANPDKEENTKQCVISIARRSKNTKLKKALVPEGKSTAKVGPDYNFEMAQFVREKWNAKKAALNSESLRRCIKQLEAFVATS